MPALLKLLDASQGAFFVFCLPLASIIDYSYLATFDTGMESCAMVFSSTIFLFTFLPLVLGIYFTLPRPVRNVFLLMFSVAFYAWGEPRFFTLLLASIAGNYVAGLVLGRHTSRYRLMIGVLLNLTVLVAFKYSGFIAVQCNLFLQPLGLKPIRLPTFELPAGISFFTFQAISYLVDIHRKDIPAERSPVRYALYAALFPHLVAGPIVRYKDIAAQLADRRISLSDFAEGVRRFCVGLGKKVLIADTLAIAVKEIFDLDRGDRTTSVAWLGICCYALQIYFDFSGYTDMAIGLGRMFGFTFAENFNHPYSAKSVGDFWRRWHMSLSYWLRDYVYIPLGGGRRHAIRNLFITFGLCGLWHGAAWTFLIWGLWHGAWVALEKITGRSSGRILTLIVVLVGWVPFRADSFSHAGQFLAAMAGFGNGMASVLDYLSPDLVLALIAGGVCSVPSGVWIGRKMAGVHWLEPVKTMACAVIVFVSVASLAGGAYSPFLYFRF